MKQDTSQARPYTVNEAEQAIAELTGDAAKVAALLAATLNSSASLRMLGCKVPKRRRDFLPIGVQSLVEIEDLLATMPAEVALVKASMAFPCDWCGMPAETGAGDGWVCDACYAKATAAPPSTSEGEGNA